MIRRLRAWLLRLAALVGAGRTDRDIADELSLHRDLLAEELRHQGLEDADAQRAAGAAMGSLAAAASNYRDRRGLPALDALLRDVRYAIRSLRQSPILTASMVLVLGLGVGVTTALATVLHSLAWQTLPVPDAGRVVKASMRLEGKFSRHVRGQDTWFSYPELATYAGRTRALEGIAGADYEGMVWQRDDASRTISAGLVTPAYFQLLHTPYVLGQPLTRSDAGRPVAVISERFWDAELGHRADVLGASLTLDRMPYAIVGVVAAPFAGTDATPVDVWVPVETAAAARGDHSLDDVSFSWLQPIARLAPGSSLEAANAEGKVLAAEFDRSAPGQHATITVTRATRLDPSLLDGHDRLKLLAAGLAAAGTAAVLLLICGSNVAGLLLARGALRQKEFAVRIALGAGRARLAQQLAVEVAVVAVASALAAIGLCALAMRVAAVWLPIQDVVGTLDPDARMFGFAFAAAAFVTFLCGLAPIRHAFRVDCLAGLKGDLTLPSMRARRWLVGLQVAVSLILIVTGGLFARAIEHATRLDVGYAIDGLTAIQPETASISGDSRIFMDQLREALLAVPGVTVVGRTSNAPFSGVSIVQWGEAAAVHFNHVDPEYFRALGVRLLAGRFPLEAETDAVLVNARYAARLGHSWADVLDRAFPMAVDGGAPRPLRVVGIVPPLSTYDIAAPDDATYYLPIGVNQAPRVLLARAALGPGEALAIANAVRRVSGGALVRVSSVQSSIEKQTAPARLSAAVAGATGLLALLVAAIGIHGIVAHAVIARTKEIGLHVALGASRARVLGYVMRFSGREVLWGAVAGGAFVVIMAAAFPAPARSALFGLSPFDPVALSMSGLVLAIVVAAAAFLPARRALRLAPAEVLRSAE